MQESVVVCGVLTNREFESSLALALGPNTKFVSEPFDIFSCESVPSLLVGIYTKGSEAEQLAFNLWAQRIEAANLTVELASHEVMVGPLAQPGLGGCGYCARARRVAASPMQDRSGDAAEPAAFDFSTVTARMLADEIRRIAWDQPRANATFAEVLIWNLQTGAASRRSFVPLPWCRVCGGAGRGVRPKRAMINLSAALEPELILNALSGVVDANLGIVSSIQFELPDDGKELPIIATAAPPHLLRNDGSLRRLPLGWGKGMNLSAAILSAVGEAVERYSASLPNPELIVWKNCDELVGEFIDPRDCALYSERQYNRADFPYVRFDPTIAHPWVLGHWAHDDSAVWVPAMYAYLSLSAGEQNVFCQGTSNGLAAGISNEDASVRALFELVERDAFMTAWLTGATGERIELDDSLDPELRQVLDGLESMGAAVELYLLPKPVLGSAVLCLALGDGVRYPGVTFGLAAHLDIRRAICQAILEAAQTGPYLRRMMQSKQLTVPERPNAVRDMLDHAAYYFPVERIGAFSRLRLHGKKAKLEELLRSTRVADSSLRGCAARLRDQGVRVALVNVTSPDIALSPFTVMRAVSAELQPISYGYGLDFAPVKRIRSEVFAAEEMVIHPIW